MVFSSLTFLFWFLPFALAVYFASPKRLKNGVLAALSLGFYTWGSGALVLILLVSIAADYGFGFLADRGHQGGHRGLIRIAVTGSVVVNLALLSYFKYANFFVEQLNNTGNALGLGAIAWDSVTLPIGISFFTFQSMSYTIDVARGRARHLRNPIDFALYVALFPQLIAGPIVRYHEIASELRTRSTKLNDFAEGAIRFSHGLVKKVVIADSVARTADFAFSEPTGELSFIVAWAGAAAYTVQIYFDFSGYSDMAIGLGRMFGFHFPENFNRPYSAVSITDFWRRWHITLSNWFRDYVFIPLGGSRTGVGRMYANLVGVFVLSGFWHGASWNFVVWGAYHGIFLLLERLFGLRRLGAHALPSAAARTRTLLVVVFGWVFFRADDLGHAVRYLGAMVRVDKLGSISELTIQSGTHRSVVFTALGALVVLLPSHFVTGRYLVSAVGRGPTAARFALMGIAVPYAFILASSGVSPFLYLRF